MREEERYLRSLGYLLGEKFSSGTFSTIHLCLRVKDGEKVAVKLIDLRSTTREYRKRFLTRELANVASLNHPNIIRVHKVGRSESKAYIIMDFAHTNLHKQIELRSYVNEEQARKWFKQLTSALVYLHQRRVVHRDIKIENILLDENYDIKLCDFGFSKICENSSSHSTTFCGSLGYCAPEILLRTPYDPWKTDVWSLGVVLYKMVVGGMPFGEGNDLGSVRKIARAQAKVVEFPTSPKTSVDCQNLIKSLLTVETANRIHLRDITRSNWFNPDISKSKHQKNSSIESTKLFRKILPPEEKCANNNQERPRKSVARSACIYRWLPSLGSRGFSSRFISTKRGRPPTSTQPKG